jgi:hypothetical protein
MLLREEDDGVLAIGQASHAWVSGQLARAWRDVGPRREEVCLAAEQHDVGWAVWDLRPTLDPETGLPHTFLTVDLATRLRIWREAPWKLVSQSVYAALLVSLHGTRLLAGQAGAEEYLAEQAELQRRWALAAQADEAQTAAHRDLLRAWDELSLALCLRWDDAERLDPWPFAADELDVSCEGRLLDGRRYADEPELHDALRRAPLRTLRFALRRP